MPVKQYFSYNRVNGVFAGVGQAPEDPEHPGVFMLPAFATFDPPPALGANDIAVWGGSAWVVDQAPPPVPVTPVYKGSLWRIKLGMLIVHYAIALAAKISPDITPAKASDLANLNK